MNKNNIQWVEADNSSMKQYITLYLNNNQTYLNKKTKEKIDFEFNYVKLGLDNKNKKLFIKPIPTNKEENFSLLQLTKFNSNTNKFSNVNFIKEILKILNEKNLSKKYKSLRISTTVEKKEDIGLVIIGDLDNISLN